MAAAAFAFSSTAAARPQQPGGSDSPASPGTATAPTSGPASGAATNPASADATKVEAKKEDGDDAKKKVAQGTDGAGGPAGPPAGGAKESVGSSDVIVSAGTTPPRKDEVRTQTNTVDEEPISSRFAGSIIFWDHSVSTQTARLEPSAQQSFTPLYEWWVSFQPRYNFTKRLSYRLRMDYTKELTNSGDSTYYREGMWGDVWNTLRYELPPFSERLKNTKVSVNASVKLPLSKESQAQGVYFKAGAGAGISQKIPINGPSAKWFPDAGLSLSGGYEHAFSRATSPSGYGGTEFVRQDTDGRTLVTDQLSGGFLPNHRVLGSVRGDLSITEKWSTSLSLILINTWNYTPKDEMTVRTDTGRVTPSSNGDTTNFNQSSWIILGTDYELLDEVSLGAGYYNLAGIIASDGQRRGVVGDHNIWWSPSARVFATVTANLDKIYNRAAGIKPKPKEAAKSGPVPTVGPTAAAAKL